MCLIAFSWNPGADMPLLLLANRDEFYARASSPAEWWQHVPGVWGGRDLEAGGTWMGITQKGRFAALTNFRSGVPHPTHARSRGMLVAEFLDSDTTPADYAQAVMADADAYNGFNLIVGDIYGVDGAAPSLWYCGNQAGAQARALPAGLYGLSNAVLDTPWPKLTRLKARLSGVGGSRDDLVDVCMAFLSDPTPADDSDLPVTGISRERERALSPVFIVSPTYGTRAQTVVRADRSGMIEATERSYESAAQASALQPAAVRRMRFMVPAG
ncbi:NRDE family protein [Achromobacter sp. GG226]|uniref:NRDE family protein n=1 Tax=Verticiella alkaliphila TaxID=2779529 RepID=UPI001C0E80EF|nr:NRDE family protein [Verticiella sp. GG226]MBU4611522.1 NRDE family protein [Verticiella sp. GG226]